MLVVFRIMAVVGILVILLLIPTVILAQSMGPDGTSEWKDFWIARLFLNLLGYAIIVVPGYVVIRYVRKSKYLDTAG